MASPTATVAQPAAAARPTDLALARGLWVLLLAQFLATLPLSVVAIFLPAMAADLGRSVALVGGLRSLGGVAALACGVLAAPLIDRLARAWTVAGGLALLAGATALAARGTLPAVALFYLLLGAAGAVYQPALQSAAADGLDVPTGARAAALLSAMAALAPILGGPAMAAAAGWIGWRGAFLASASLIALVAALALAALGRRPPVGVARTRYREAFRAVAAAPGALPLLLGSTLRFTAQFAWATYLTASLADRFGASSGTAALVWGLAGASFFVANLAVGRLLDPAATGGWRAPARLLPAILLAMAALAPASLLAPTLPAATAAAGLAAGTTGAAVAAIISLLVGRYAPLRGAVLGLNAAGSSLGLIAGAALGGAALGVGGYPGLALALLSLTGASVAAIAWALRPAARSAD